MGPDFRSLANSFITDIIPYQPGKPIAELERELGITSVIKLASNENALGPSSKAIAAAQTELWSSHVYPDGSCFELKQALGRFLNVPPNQLTIGNGSENILELIIKSYLTLHDSALISQYAFLSIPLLIKSYGAEVIRVPEFQFRQDTTAMVKAVTDQTRILFIVNPNNPTGTYIKRDELKDLLDSLPSRILVVIDEAYYEYLDQPDYPQTLPLLDHYPNLIITRTFSKVYGLAALRLGYAISSTEIADILNRARVPFNVNSIAAIAGQAALLDQEHVERTLNMTRQGMEQMVAGLKKLKMDYIPSVGNFITVDLKRNATEIYQKLLYQGIIVRPLTAYALPSHLRITIGTAEQNERFLSAFHQVYQSS